MNVVNYIHPNINLFIEVAGDWQHTILDIRRISQSSLDPVFCTELCIVEISVRMIVLEEFRNRKVILDNEGCS